MREEREKGSVFLYFQCVLSRFLLFLFVEVRLCTRELSHIRSISILYTYVYVQCLSMDL